jgi:hypothetical protein
MERWQRSGVATWRCVSGGLAAAAPGHAPLAMSAPAAALWQALAEPRTAQSVALELGAPTSEVRQVLDDLLEHGLVEVTL